LGFGRPNAGDNRPIAASEMASLTAAAQLCGNRQEACAGALGLAGDLRSTILNNLDRVKAELKESKQARSDRRRNIGNDLATLIERN